MSTRHCSLKKVIFCFEKTVLIVEIVEHSLAKKQQEMENLLQHFRERNEQYEHLLNQSIMVNNQIHKKKIQKITKIKEIEKNKFKKRLEYFLNNSGVNPEKIKGLKIRTRSKKKVPSPPKKLKKKKSKSFLEIVKKSIMFGQSSVESQSVKSTSIDKKFNDVSKGPEMFVNYESHGNSESSSDGEIDRKIQQMQNPRHRQKLLEDRRVIDEISEESDKPSKAESSDTKVKLMNLSRNFASRKKVSGVKNSKGPRFQFESQVIMQKKIKLGSKKGNSMQKNDSVSSKNKESKLKLSNLDGKISISRFQKCRVWGFC